MKDYESAAWKLDTLRVGIGATTTRDQHKRKPCTAYPAGVATSPLAYHYTMLNLFKPKIEFLTHPKNHGLIPEPYPAIQHLPSWYKKLPHREGHKGIHTGTVKRCAPFLDAMGLGYIIPLAGDIEIVMSDEGATVNTESEFWDKIIGTHSDFQLGPDHPSRPSPTLKFSNFWAMKVPVGWSVLFIPPLNRPDPRFECFSGVVECDKYFNFVNFPFAMKDLSFSGIIPQGTPMVQAIPFKRTGTQTKFRCGVLSAEQTTQIENTIKQLKGHESHYRDNLWDKKTKCPYS